MKKNTDINYSIDLLRRDKEGRKHIIEELLFLKKKYNITNCSILELGSGLGQNLEVFRKDNSVKGVEGLLAAVKEARYMGLDVIHADLDRKIDIPNNSQDWALCLDVLEHLINPLGAMMELRRILKDGGRAIINVPNHLDLKGRIKLLLGSGLDVHKYFPDSNDWDTPHLRFFTYRGFKKLLDTSGFYIVEDRSFRFSGIPGSKFIARLCMGFLLEYFVKKSPSLFAGGFFVIVEKKVA